MIVILAITRQGFFALSVVVVVVVGVLVFVIAVRERDEEALRQQMNQVAIAHLVDTDHWHP